MFFFSKKPKGPSDAEILSRVKKVVADQLGVDEYEVVPNAQLGNDLGADELDAAELVLALGKEFIAPVENFKDYNTISDVVRCVRKGLEKKF